MVSVTDADYKHVKRVWEDCGLENLNQYHDVYIQSDTVLLADIFESFRNKFLEIYELDPAHFLSAHELT